MADADAVRPGPGPAGPDRATDGRTVGVLLFALACALYYTANFLLRWDRYHVFPHPGLFLWPRPGPLHYTAIILGSVAGPLVPFGIGAALAIGVARRFALPVMAGLACLVLCFAELDHAWYALSGDHVRLVDVELFIGLDIRDHLGVNLTDMASLVVACAGHVAILVTGALAAGALIRRRTQALGGARARRLPLVLAGPVLLLGNAGAWVYSTDQAWRTISAANLLNGTVSTLTTRVGPEARALQRLYADLPPAPLPPPAPAAAAAPGASILVIAIEGWNPDYADAVTMPVLARLRRESAVFHAHYSTGDNTLMGVLGLLYGQSPTFFYEHTARGQRSLFLDALSEQGYRSQYVGKGLSSYRFIDSYLTAFTDGGDPVPTGGPAIRSIAGFIQAHPRTFTFYYYYGTHFPYIHGSDAGPYLPEIPNDYQFDGNRLQPDREAIRNKYRNTLVRADAFLGRLLAELPWRRMIVVITGDHGEAMLEHGRLSHSSSVERPQTGTPMLVYYPGVRPAEYRFTTSHLDVFPTIFAVLGLPLPPGAQGRSMLDGGTGAALTLHNNQNRRAVEAALIAGGTKVLVDLTDLRAPRFTGLRDDHDRPLGLPGREEEVRHGLRVLRALLGPDGCDSRSALAPYDTTAAARLATLRLDLRSCPEEG